MEMGEGDSAEEKANRAMIDVSDMERGVMEARNRDTSEDISKRWRLNHNITITVLTASE